MLKKRPLTILYNLRPTWLANWLDRLDRAVWEEYGWTDDPADTTEDELPTRLLAINQEQIIAREVSLHQPDHLINQPLLDPSRVAKR